MTWIMSKSPNIYTQDKFFTPLSLPTIDQYSQVENQFFKISF